MLQTEYFCQTEDFSDCITWCMWLRVRLAVSEKQEAQGWGGHRTWLLERTWLLPGAHVRGKGWGGNSPVQTGPRLCDTRGRECLVPGRSRCRACLIWHETSASFTQSLSPAGLLGQCYLERRLYTGNEYIDNRAKLIDQDFQWLIATPDEKDGKKPGHSWTPLPAPSRVFRSSGFKT